MVNILVDETKDYKEIVKIINRPDYKEWLIDKDGDVADKDLDIPNIIYYLFSVDNEVAGFCALRKIYDDVSIADIAILEKFRGKTAKHISNVAINKYILESTCKMLITRINKENKRSLYFAKWLGFVKYLDDDNYIYLRLKLWVEQ